MTASPRSRPVERFVEIASALTVHRAISTAVRLVAPVRIVGIPGTGKTAALEHYAPEFGATYCQCAGFAKDIRGLFRLLVAAMGIYTDARHTGELADVLFERLSNRSSSHAPLLVDEWQTLEPPAQRELMRLAETCRIPLVLCGNAERLFTSRTHKAALAQIESRIAAEFKTTGLSDADCDSIAIEHNVEGKDARDLLRRLGAALQFRGLNDVLVEARSATGGRGSIQLRHLELALASLNYWARFTMKEGKAA